MRYSPAPETQLPTINGAPEGSFDAAQQPDPYIAANPTRPLIYQKPFGIKCCKIENCDKREIENVSDTFMAIPPLEDPDAICPSESTQMTPTVSIMSSSSA